MTPIHAQLLARVTALISVAALESGLSKQKREGLRRNLMDLEGMGLIQRCRHAGLLHVAPVDWQMDPATMATYALSKVTPDSAGCMHWFGGLDAKRGALAFHGRKAFNLRRAVFELKSGKAIPERKTVHMVCECDRCIEYGHMVLKPRGAPLIGKKRPQNVCRRIAQTKREQLGTSMDLVRELRAQFAAKELRQVDVARQLGISQSNAGKLLRGESWRDFDNPYTDLIRRSA